MLTEIEVQTERSLRCSYRFVSFDKRFHNESLMLTSPIHGSKRNEKQWHYKETDQNGIIPEKNDIMTSEKKTAAHVT